MPDNTYEISLDDIFEDEDGTEYTVTSIDEDEDGIVTLESAEEIVELSKKTLGSYVKKSVNDLDNASDRGARAARDAMHGDKFAWKVKNSADRRALKRTKGINKAVDKLTKEETNLSDLIVHALNKKPIEFSESLENAILDRIEPLINGMREEIAKTMFNSVIETEDKKKIIHFEITNEETGEVIGKTKTLESAQDMVDRRDNADSEHNFYARAVYEDEINELSKKTLGSYIKHASNSASEASGKAKVRSHMAWMGQGDLMNNKNAEKKHLKTVEKRTKGIEIATKKLAKEEEIDELSKETLTSYKDKAHKDISTLGKKSGDALLKGDRKNSDKLFDKMIKRVKGAGKAADKVNFESEEMSEGMIHYDNSRDDSEISHYVIKHKNGNVVGKAKTKNGARKSVDTHDNKYGGYAHSAHAMYHPKATNEEEISEVSKDLVKNYIRKATGDRDNAQAHIQYGKGGKKHDDTIQKRNKGIKRAISKLLKKESQEPAYAPDSEGELAFFNLHYKNIKKNKDSEGNDDKMFKASNVKTFDRKSKRMGAKAGLYKKDEVQ